MEEIERGRTGWQGTQFRIERRLSGGGSSEVYEARDAAGQPCAIKVQRAIRGADAWRFARELALLSRIRHPNLIRVSGGGVTRDDRPFVVLELLRGRTLREAILLEGPLAPHRACTLLIGVLDGLERAHREGIVHRDVKPANVFVDRDEAGTERAVLIDFGAAIDAGPHEEVTTDTHVFGSAAYLAPEQVLGGRVDARTDVYAAGLTLFEAIAGKSPYAATCPMGFLRAHVASAPERLNALVPVGRGLSGVVARALEKEPGRRWPSARAFAAALRRVAIASDPRRALARTVSRRPAANGAVR